MINVPYPLTEVYIPIDRFWSRVIKRGPDECWEWFKAGSNKYGQIKLKNRHYQAHRIAFFLEYGIDPAGDILHHCDNRLCCNPRHLYEGTDLENARDRERRGRGAQLKGEKHPHAKLTKEFAVYIRSHYKPKPNSNAAQLARSFGVSQSLVFQLARGKYWK